MVVIFFIFKELKNIVQWNNSGSTKLCVTKQSICKITELFPGSLNSAWGLCVFMRYSICLNHRFCVTYISNIQSQFFVLYIWILWMCFYSHWVKLFWYWFFSALYFYTAYFVIWEDLKKFSQRENLILFTVCTLYDVDFPLCCKTVVEKLSM